MKRKIMITGSSGLVGSNFMYYLSLRKKYGLIGLYNSHPTNFPSCQNIKIDITKRDEVMSLQKIDPDVIIHCAALTNTAFCEANKNFAHKINVGGTKNIAELASKTSSKLIYISTDAVFDGLKGNYDENDKPNPLNVYGKTKLEGEKACLTSHNDTIIARTNVFGKNLVINKLSFIEDVIEHFKNGWVYKGFYDVKTSIISLKFFTDLIMALYEKDAKGLYHTAGSESISKYDFVKLVAEVFGFDQKLVKRDSVESLFPKDNTRRPKDCSLNISKMLDLLESETTPPIRDMLIDFKTSFKHTMI